MEGKGLCRNSLIWHPTKFRTKISLQGFNKHVRITPTMKIYRWITLIWLYWKKNMSLLQQNIIIPEPSSLAREKSHQKPTSNFLCGLQQHFQSIYENHLFPTLLKCWWPYRYKSNSHLHMNSKYMLSHLIVLSCSHVALLHHVSKLNQWNEEMDLHFLLPCKMFRKLRETENLWWRNYYS